MPLEHNYKDGCIPAGDEPAVSEKNRDFDIVGQLDRRIKELEADKAELEAKRGEDWLKIDQLKCANAELLEALSNVADIWDIPAARALVAKHEGGE